MKKIFCMIAPCLLVFLIVTAYGATPGSGTLTPPLTSGGTSSVSWVGGPYTAVTADPSVCTASTCDNFTLIVNVPATFYTNNPNSQVRVHISWETNIGPVGDFDVYIYDASGNLVNSGTQGNTTFEDVNLEQLPSGTYRVQVVAYATVNASYTGRATLGPPPADQVRLAKYKKGNFTFTAPLQLKGPDDLLFGVQDLEPRAAFDPLGNIYVAAIQGTPAGTDVWKSADGGNTFTYLGQPDGAQAAAAIGVRGGGAGGGDEDIAISSSGRVYVASLWGVVLGTPVGGVGAPTAATMCISTNGGAAWVSNPYSQDVPLVDRQWMASYKENILYMTFEQLGVLLVGTNSIFVLKSTDGGLTFPQVTEVTTPELGVQPGFQGNIVVDQRNGNVYTVFAGHFANELYLARSTDGGKSFILKIIHSGPIGSAVDNVFPIIAVDRGSNLYVVYSDGTNIYLTSSSDQGATWTVPVRVNNGTDTKTALAPWIDAGDAGKVNIMWWGTSSASSLADDAQWKVLFAQSQNALAKTPTITQSEATGVFHTGPICVNGTGCTEGSRDLAEYASTTVYLDGKALIVYPDDQQTSNPLTYFIKQTGGLGVISSTPGIASQSGTSRKETTVPKEYLLEQNYPNPFNPSTTIRYALPVDGHVRLNVYDLFGREVALLVNADQSAGTYSLTFEASRLSSGVYYYKLSLNNFVDTKRMVILK